MRTSSFATLIATALIVVGCSTPPPKDPSNNETNGATNGATNGTTNGGTNGGTNGSAGPFIDPNDYDQSCEWDSECALVRGGDVCGCGMICAAAISQDAVEDFNADVEAVDCTNVEPGPCPGAACQEQIAVCASGDCEAIPKVNLDPGQFDRSCELDEDCMLINSGEICSACDCSRSAINVADAEQYEALVSGIDCKPGPNVCDCEPPNEAWCDAGTCEARFGG